MHQAFFSAPITTIIDAAQNDQLKDIPFLNDPNMIRKYLPPLSATAKGRTKKPRAGVGSTRPKPRNTKCSLLIFKTEIDCKAEEEAYAPNGANNIFCYTALADKQTGTLYK